jgi:lysozyme family protein
LNVDFDEAFEKLIGHEGGYQSAEQAVEHRDSGGETKFGISKREYPELDIAALTLEDAKAIYLRDYWNKVGCDSVPEAVRFSLFDTAVQSGQSLAIKTLQQAVFANPDGVIGQNTRSGIAVMQPDCLIRRFNGLRLLFLTEQPNWPQMGRGYARRIATNLLEASA